MKNHFSFRHHLKTYEQTVKPIRNTGLQITLTDPKSKLPDLALGPLAPNPQPFQKHTLIMNVQFRSQSDFDYVEVRVVQANSMTLVNLYQITFVDHIQDLRFDFWTYAETVDPLMITFKYISDYPSSTVYKLNYVYLECPYTLSKSISSQKSLKIIYNDYKSSETSETRLEIRPEKFLDFDALPRLKTYFAKPIPWDLFGHIFIQIYLKANFEQNIHSLVQNVLSHRPREQPHQLASDIPLGTRSLAILITELQMCYDHFREMEVLYNDVENRKHLLESKILSESATRSPEELRAEMARNRDRLYQKYRTALKNKYNEVLSLKKEIECLSTGEDRKRVGYILTCYQQRIIKDLEQFQEARIEARPEAKLRIPRQALDDCLRDYRIQKVKVGKAKEQLDRQLMYVFQSWYLALRNENANPNW